MLRRFEATLILAAVSAIVYYELIKEIWERAHGNSSRQS
jgi:hypothetical protein